MQHLLHDDIINERAWVLPQKSSDYTFWQWGDSFMWMTCIGGIWTCCSWTKCSGNSLNICFGSSWPDHCIISSMNWHTSPLRCYPCVTLSTSTPSASRLCFYCSRLSPRGVRLFVWGLLTSSLCPQQRPTFTLIMRPSVQLRETLEKQSLILQNRLVSSS